MIALRVQPGHAAARALTDIKLLATRFPGEHELEIRVSHRTLRLGPIWTYDGSPECLAALGEFGTVEEAPSPTPTRRQHDG